MKFTDASIKGLKTKPDRYEVWETNGKGFGLRVSPSGRKSWIFMYRVNGVPRRMTLGTYPAFSLADANTEHAKARQKLDRGIDPGEELLKDKRGERDAHTIKGLCDEYIEKWAKPNKRTWKEDKRIIDKDIIPAWGRRKAKDIKRRDTVVLLDKIVNRGAPIQANRTLAVIRKMFNFAMSRSLVDSSPCAAIGKPAKENQRDRILTANEIREFWIGLDRAKISEGIKIALKLQLVTAQRKGEIAGLEWKDLDIKNSWWTIPSEKSKNRMTHRVPLTKMALGILREAKYLAGDSQWVFPGGRQNSHITEPAIDQAIRKNRDAFDIDHFTPHDLRRTAASLMTGAGIPRLTVGKILNHVEGGVTAVYDRHSYDKEKKQALNTWSRKLETILTGNKSKVISLAQRKK